MLALQRPSPRVLAIPDRIRQGLVSTQLTPNIILCTVAVLLATLLFSRGVWRSSPVVDGVRYFALGDDAMISMRYAYNAASGLGLVWNAGDRVQGYTNLGWTLLMVVPHALAVPLNLAPLVIQLTNLVLHLGLVMLVYTFLRRTTKSPSAGLAALLVGLNGPLLIWGIEGFETTLQSLLVTAALLPMHPSVLAASSSPRKLWLTPILLSLAFFVRPDSGVLLATGSLLALTPELWHVRPHFTFDRRALLAVGVSLSVVVAVLVWQRIYYGEWLPNTAVLKASSDARELARGLSYLRRFFLDDFQGGLLLAALVYIGSGLLARTGRLAYVPALAIVSAWLIYLVWVGGDVFPASRFFTPIIPLLAVFATALIDNSLFRGNPWRPGSDPLHRSPSPTKFTFGTPLLGAVLALLCVTTIVASPWQVLTTTGVQKGENLGAIATAISLSDPSTGLLPTDTIAVFLAGTVPYLMPAFRFHDMLGKSDAYIARTPAKWGPPGHNKWDLDYTLDQVRPQIIVAGLLFGISEAEKLELLDRRADHGYYFALWFHPTFRRLYLPNPVPITVGGQVIPLEWVYRRAESPSPR